MLKRILLLMMTLLLLLTAHAGAEELYAQIDAALYQIVLRTDAGDKPLGSGVLFGDPSVLLTAGGCCAEGSLYAIGNDGEYAVERISPLGSGASLLTLAAPASATPLTLAPGDSQSLPYIFGVDAAGERISMPLYKARADMQDALYTLLLSSEEGLLPGGFLTDEQGRVSCLITGQQMEGHGSYSALGMNALGQLLSTEETADKGFLDCSFTWEDGRLTISWTDKMHTEGVYVITLLTEENQYYTTYETDIRERSLVITPPPGHTYSLQVQRAASEAEALEPDWDVLRDYTLPLLPFPAYNMQSECTILSIPAGTDVTGEEKPLTTFTTAALTDPGRELLLRVDCSYTIPAVHTANLALELLAPDGQFFFDEQVIELDPADAAADCFVFPLDALMDSCVKFSGGALQAGPHTVRFFLDGCIGGEYTFTVPAEDAPAVSPAPTDPANTGFVTDFTCSHENGRISAAWSSASVPEGAKLRAYCLYEGNIHFSYIDLEPGTESADLFTVPGRRTVVWIVWTKEDSFASLLPDISDARQYCLLEASPEAPLTAHSFRNVRIGLAASADPTAGSSTDFLPQAPITREMLSDRSTPIYFMTEDTYQVGATTEDHPLLIVLTTPEGTCFADIGTYIFDRSLQASDLWLKDISQLFANYEAFSTGTSWPAGEYRILYCIDGQVAGEISFTLE